MKAMLFAAGLGTRLKPFTEHAPKALAKIGENTLLEVSLKYLQKFGIYDVIVNVHHFADMVEDVLHVNRGFGSRVSISDERAVILETGGGLKKAEWFFSGEETFIVMNVDIVTNLDLQSLIEKHLSNKAISTLAVMKRTSSRYLLFNEQDILCGWENVKIGEKKISRPSEALHPMAFSGIQVLSKAVWDDMPFDGKFSLIDLYLHIAKTEIIKGYDHTGDTFIDVGKPESLEQARLLLR